MKEFVLLVFVLSIAIWLVGGTRLPLPVNLPVSALTAFVPMIAASILSFRRQGSEGIKELFQMACDHRKISNKVWYFPIIFLAPFMYLLSLVVMWVMERPLPDPIQIPVLWLPGFIVLYLITGAGKELGWSGYATEPIQNRWGVLGAGFLLGIIWAIWHSIAFMQTGSAVEWVIWQSVKTIAMHMIIV
jgi:membrane protease YdiL (CAAX protease family)